MTQDVPQHHDRIWTTVRRLFEQCLELEPAARAALLEKEQPELQAEVRSLLMAHDSGGQRLDPDQAHRALLLAGNLAPWIGTQIGRYRILGLLGRGGMGTVFLAEQEQPRRQVALKLLSDRPGDIGNPGQVQHEAALLARLQHPGIAQIYEAGVHATETASGPVQWPYFAMELVHQPRTLIEFVQGNELSERDCIELFLQLCAALQHAHERGVVHRDLKPHNVLVDREGRVKVVDFGIGLGFAASGERQGSRTRTGDLIGTLHYMSPEQIRRDLGEIGTRSDVHALGVLLHEMLTGRLPFDLKGCSLPEVGRVICESEPMPLRSVLDHADPDLELILRTALAKDPDRRYPSAGALAEDLRRYLDREPIRARPPSLRYQFRMFTRRRRSFVVAALLLLVIAVFGAATSIGFALRARDAERVALVEAGEKIDTLRRMFDMAMRSVVELPARLADVPGSTTLRSEVIERAVRQLEEVEARMPLDYPLRLSLARAYFELGAVKGIDASGHVGEREAAARHLAQARRHLDAVLTQEPSDAGALFFEVELECVRGSFALDVQFDLAAARRHDERATQAIERLRGLPIPEGHDLLLAEAGVQKRKGHLAAMDGRADEALGCFQRALDLSTRANGGGVPDRNRSAAVAALHYHIGLIEDARENGKKAQQAFGQAIAALDGIGEHEMDRSLAQLRARVRCLLGYSLVRAGESAVGGRELRWSFLELERLLTMDPRNASLIDTLSLACSMFAEHLVVSAQRGTDPLAARQLYLEATRIAERGLELARPQAAKAREMQTIFVIGECERLLRICREALK